ncbi:hypothetical protein KY333_03575 [Candidatus Woesearchaeota archaeon]|nr:hypothetical protein [Candidatus Woesearchaeota archaeon]MBW2994230.1 hypothetical protein [Candidatus Woesearchaeota archaeon]
MINTLNLLIRFFVCVRNSNKLSVYLIMLLLLSISQVSAITDDNLTNNVMNMTVDVVETEILSFSFVHYAANSSNRISPEYGGYADLVKEHANFISAVFPIRDESPIIARNESSHILVSSDLKERMAPGEDYSCALSADLEKQMAAASSKNKKIIGIMSEGFSDKYAGGDAGFRCPGLDKTVFVTEKIDASDYKETSAAHEVGHTFNLCDEYANTSFYSQNQNRLNGCPNGDKNEDGRLDSECMDTYGISGLKGCPVENQELILDLFYKNQNITTLVNLYGGRVSLTPNQKRWINNQTYSHLLSELQGSGKMICTDEKMVIISGNITKSFNLSLDNFYIVQGGCYMNNSAPIFNASVLNVQQKGTGGILYDFFRIISFGLYKDGGEFVELDEMSFVITMPYDENATTFDFLNYSNNVTLSQRNATPNTPSINITYPSGNEVLKSPFNITWSASDADNDSVFYAVLLSYDGGGNYTTLDLDLNQSYYEIDPDDFDYSENSVIKILATDGVNTGINTSNTFTLGNPLKASLQPFYSNDALYVFEFVVNNRGSANLTNVSWSFDLGDTNTVTNDYPVNLGGEEAMTVLFEYTYNSANQFTAIVNVSAGNISAVDGLTVGGCGLIVSNLSVVYASASKRVFEAIIFNNETSSMGNINWTFNTGEGAITANQLINLSANEEIPVYVEYTYNNPAEYTVNMTASVGACRGTRDLSISLAELSMQDFSKLSSSGTNAVFEFSVENIGSSNKTFHWSFDTNDTAGIIWSSQPVTLMPNANLSVLLEHNFTSTGGYEVFAWANTSQGNYSEGLNISLS